MALPRDFRGIFSFRADYHQVILGEGCGNGRSAGVLNGGYGGSDPTMRTLSVPASNWRASGGDETRQLEGPLIEGRGRLTSELEMPHTYQAVRKFRGRILPDEQRLLDRPLPFDLQ